MEVEHSASDGGWKHRALSPTSEGYGLQFLYWGFPLSTTLFSFTAALASESLTQQLFSTLGMKLDPSRGNITAMVFDCAGNPAPGVEVTPDPSDPLMQEIYGTTLMTTRTETDSTGFLMFLNVPVGIYTLTATPLALGKASSTQRVQVRANAWNYMPIPVTP